MHVSRETLATAVAGRYTVERLLGRGGMGSVYLGRDAGGEPVALKVFDPRITASLPARRFHREIAFLRRLDHPNILPVLEASEAGPVLYFVAPYAPDGSLAGRLAERRRLPLDAALAIVTQVAAALDHAHARDVLHRDIKPANILFHGDRVMVCDFGIARALDAMAGDESTSGAVLGTPAYMSPEQARGIRPLDQRSDIYTLGVVAYEMLAGEPPFTGPTPQAIVARQALERPPRLHIVRPDLPPHVETAVEKALAKQPLSRPWSAGTFARALAGSG